MCVLQTYFLLKLVVFVFKRIEMINTELQKNLSFIEAKRKADLLQDSLQEIRQNDYSNFWDSVILQAVELGIEVLLPSQRKIPKKLNIKNETQHVFDSPK